MGCHQRVDIGTRFAKRVRRRIQRANLLHRAGSQMKLHSGLKVFVATMVVAFGAHAAQASHIDELGIRITVASSDGLGNFTLRYEEFFGSDGASWNGTNWSGFGHPYNTSFNIALTSGPGTLSPTGFIPVSASFAGLVNSAGIPTPGFGVGQFTTQFVNGLSDAAVFEQLLNFTITGFDSSQTYLVDVSANDCCFVSGNGGPSFDGQLQFDPRVVVGQVPEPASMAIWGLGSVTAMAFGWRRRRKLAA